MLGDVSLKELIRHSEAAFRIEVLLGQKEAVFAAQIARRSRGFGQEMKAGKYILLGHLDTCYVFGS